MTGKNNAPLSVVTFLWRAPASYRSKFTGEHVDILRRMVRRHYPAPHRFVCITDGHSRITEPDVEQFRLWDDFAYVANPSGRKNPSCYRRLRLFASNNASWLGERFVCVDLDSVIVGDMRPLWNRPEDFVIWRSTTSGNPYCGSMFLHRTGTLPQLWSDFDPVRSPLETRRSHLYGSDQAWIAYRLGRGLPTWGPEDGVLSYRNDLQKSGRPPPTGTRIVFFHGRPDPWADEVYKRNAWVREAYR